MPIINNIKNQIFLILMEKYTYGVSTLGFLTPQQQGRNYAKIFSKHQASHQVRIFASLLLKKKNNSSKKSAFYAESLLLRFEKQSLVNSKHYIVSWFPPHGVARLENSGADTRMRRPAVLTCFAADCFSRKTYKRKKFVPTCFYFQTFDYRRKVPIYSDFPYKRLHLPTLHCTIFRFALDWESHKSLKHECDCLTTDYYRTTILFL